MLLLLLAAFGADVRVLDGLGVYGHLPDLAFFAVDLHAELLEHLIEHLGVGRTEPLIKILDLLIELILGRIESAQYIALDACINLILANPVVLEPCRQGLVLCVAWLHRRLRPVCSP